MPSIAVTGKRYLVKPESVDKNGPFHIRILAEGDSWMDRSGPVAGSLPDYLATAFDHVGVCALIINISTAGHTLRRITGTMDGEFSWWLRQFRYDGIVFSAGGNDFIDAARDPGPGLGLLKDMAGQPSPTDGYECVRAEAVKALRDQYLATNFESIYRRVRSDTLNAQVPLFLNCYDTPTARNAKAADGVGPWLYSAYRKNHIAQPLWPSLTAGIFNDVRACVEGWCTDRIGVHAVPTCGRLTPASPQSKGSSGDWQNEIHPSASGWRKQAPAWISAMRPVLKL